MAAVEGELIAGSLGGMVALVTGAGSGLGRAIAVQFAAEGAAVVCSDSDSYGVRETVAVIRGAGRTATAHVGDVTSEADCAAAVEVALAELGGLDVVVANAGIPGEGKAHEISLDDWSRVISVNLTGVFLTVRAALPHLVDQSSGSIVLTSSIAGLIGLPNIPAYAAAKGGVVALGRQLAREYAPDGVRVNVIAPGTILTPLVEEAFRQRYGDEMEGALARRATAVPLGRLGSPEDVARAAVYLGSDSSGWVTGTVLTVDGGNVHLGPVQG